MGKYKPHIDTDWINKKIGGHGGIHSYDSPTGIAHIMYIGSKNRLQVLWYNTILFLKFIKRRLLYGANARRGFTRRNHKGSKVN